MGKRTSVAWVCMVASTVLRSVAKSCAAVLMALVRGCGFGLGGCRRCLCVVV